MSEASERLWQSTFQPDCDPKELDALRGAFLAERSEVALKTLRSCNELLAAAGLEPIRDDFLELLARQQDAATLVLDDPVFAIWLRFFHRALANARQEEVAVHVKNVHSVLDDVEKRLTGCAECYAPGSLIAVQREDLHPYVMAATPPTYDFTRLPEPHDGPVIGHPLSMQAELIGHALEGIGKAWPEMKDQVFEYVRIIGYLPDSTFRSCSAARYSGVVHLGNMDESTLDLEESLVHETGHQVLYRLGGMTKLTRPGTSLAANYVLPWSGSRRDLFGYLHAYYIYALLTKYYWRRAACGDRYANDCSLRAGLILAGVITATPILKSDPNLSDEGQHIVAVLGAEAEQLRDAMLVKLREHYEWQGQTGTEQPAPTQRRAKRSPRKTAPPPTTAKRRAKRRSQT